jgi:hypothetical protein
MSTQTTNFGLTKDAGTDYYNIDTINKNIDRIDVALGNTAKFETAGGTATAITLSGISLTDGNSKTFIVSANNNGAATKINNKPLYKPGTTTAPKLTAGKAVTVWYNAAGDCFFIKASAEGDAKAEHVLAPYTFSNSEDTGVVGTIPILQPEIGAAGIYARSVIQDAGHLHFQIDRYSYTSELNWVVSYQPDLVPANILGGKNIGGVQGSIPIVNPHEADRVNAAEAVADGTYAYMRISPNSYYNGVNYIRSPQPDLRAANILSGKTVMGVAGAIPHKAGMTYTPSTSNQVISEGQYLDGNITVLGDADLIPANILSGKNIFGVAGTMSAMPAGVQLAIGSTPVIKSYKTFVDLSQSSHSKYYVQVSGIGFVPDIIAVYGFDAITYNTEFVGMNNGTLYTRTNTGGWTKSICCGGTFFFLNTEVASSAAYVDSTGFLLPGPNNPGSASLCYWYAIKLPIH